MRIWVIVVDIVVKLTQRKRKIGPTTWSLTFSLQQRAPPKTKQITEKQYEYLVLWSVCGNWSFIWIETLPKRSAVYQEEESVHLVDVSWRLRTPFFDFSCRQFSRQQNDFWTLSRVSSWRHLCTGSEHRQSPREGNDVPGMSQRSMSVQSEVEVSGRILLICDSCAWVSTYVYIFSGPEEASSPMINNSISSLTPSLPYSWNTQCIGIHFMNYPPCQPYHQERLTISSFWLTSVPFQPLSIGDNIEFRLLAWQNGDPLRML